MKAPTTASADIGREREIIQEATRLFSTHGYASVGIRSIADAVGIMSSTLYHYFPSKSAILYRICLMVTRDFISVHGAVLAQAGAELDRAETLRQLVRAQMDYFWHNSLAQRVASRDLRELPQEQYDEIVNWQRAYTADVVEFVTLGVKEGEFDVPAPDIAVRTAMDMLNAAFRWLVPRSDFTLRDAGDLYAHLIVDRMFGAGGRWPPEKEQS